LLQFESVYNKSRVEPGVERRIVAIIYGDEAFVLVIMPIGGSKSLLFMLPVAASQDGVTIMIVPIVALRQDICEYSNEKGILCTE
jgi:superfamily II DNA helicase RecQ